MRTFLQKSAGATFFRGDNVTVIPHKYYVELVMPVPGNAKWYVVVAVEYAGEDAVSIICDWNGYFGRIDKMPDPDKVLDRLKSSCPKLWSLVYGEAEYNILSLENERGVFGSGVGKTIKMKVDLRRPFVATVLDERVVSEALKLGRYSVELYNEIMRDCPLRAWKDDLKEKLFG